MKVVKFPTWPATIFAALFPDSAVAEGCSDVQQEHRLREVEVSVWELVAAAMFHAAAPYPEG